MALFTTKKGEHLDTAIDDRVFCNSCGYAGYVRLGGDECPVCGDECLADLSEDEDEDSADSGCNLFTRDKSVDNLMAYSTAIMDFLIRSGKLVEASRERIFHKGCLRRTLLYRNDGKIIGIEAAAHAGRPRWAAILPETGGKLVRIQYWDDNGLMGHTCFNNEQEALEAFVSMGYLHFDKGSFSRMAKTQAFIDGMNRTEDAQKAQ